MNTLQKLLTIVFLLNSLLSNGQSKNVAITLPDLANIILKDTLFNIAFDSITHDLGLINPSDEKVRLVKHFKYLGTDTILITRTWTEDPHYICEYPKAPLVPNKMYSYTICFHHQGKQGEMSKKMGFYLSDGNRIPLQFNGAYITIKNND